MAKTQKQKDALKVLKQYRKEDRMEARAQKHRELARFYNINSILGNDWAMFYCIIGSRMTGKSYAITEFLCNRKKKLGDQCKNYWCRISETSTKYLLANKAEKLVDIDLVRKYNLDLSTKGMNVYDHSKPFMTVVPLSSFGKMKGVAFYDKDFKGEINIVLDEMMLEQGEKRTSFDILYNFIGMCENIARTTKNKIRVFLIGNQLEEASTIMKAFNFIPNGVFGRYYLKKKRCVVDYLEPTDEYFKDREGSIADILGGDEMSNFTNAMTKDLHLITTKRVIRPTALIKFSKEKKNWYVLWDGKVIRRWKNNFLPASYTINMKPYLDGSFSKERKMAVIEMFDNEAFLYDSFITQTYFVDELTKIRKQ